MTTSRFDVVVVGAGIVGTSSAYYLAKSGGRVALLEKGRVAGEQSSRNWGSVRVQGRPDVEVPLMLDGIELWRGLEGELGESIDWFQRGQMLMAYDQTQLAKLERLVRASNEFDIPSRILTKKEVFATLPHFRGENCIGAMFNPDDGCAEPEKVAPAYARSALREGAQLFENCAAVEIETTAGVVSGVQTEQGRLECDVVVVACGAWTSRLLKPLGVRHPSLWIRGSVARTTPLPIQMRKLVVWGSTAYRQRADRRALVAVSEDGFHDLMADSFVHGAKFAPLALRNARLLRFAVGRPLIQSLRGEFSDFTTHRTLEPRADWRGLERAKSLFSGEYPDAGVIQYERAWAGYIDYMPDELPVIELLSNPSGLAVAAGFSGNGFGFGPVVGRTVADLVVSGRCKYDLRPFASERFQ